MLIILRSVNPIELSLYSARGHIDSKVAGRENFLTMARKTIGSLKTTNTSGFLSKEYHSVTKNIATIITSYRVHMDTLKHTKHAIGNEEEPFYVLLVGWKIPLYALYALEQEESAIPIQIDSSTSFDASEYTTLMQNGAELKGAVGQLLTHHVSTIEQVKSVSLPENIYDDYVYRFCKTTSETIKNSVVNSVVNTAKDKKDNVIAIEHRDLVTTYDLDAPLSDLLVRTLSTLVMADSNTYIPPTKEAPNAIDHYWITKAFIEFVNEKDRTSKI